MIRLFNYSGEFLTKFEKHEGEVTEIQFWLEDTILSSDNHGFIHLWMIPFCLSEEHTNSPLQILNPHFICIQTICIKNGLLVSVGDDKYLKTHSVVDLDKPHKNIFEACGEINYCQEEETCCVVNGH